jgi:nucleotide-binding universal stress UspA family protein
MIKKILVGIDGSDASITALKYAEDLAETYKSELIIITVIPNVPFIYSEIYSDDIYPEYIPRMQQDLEDSYNKLLERELERVKSERPELAVRTVIENGNPSQKIIETSRAEEIDLIVLGNRGTGGIISWLLGGTSRSVADACTVPVLIVKDEEHCMIK